jgi:MipA family protein
MTRPLLLALLLSAASAEAQEGGSASEVGSHSAQTLPPDWSVTIGAGALSVPSYPGAASSRLLPLPLVDAHYRQRLFLSPITGLGVNAIATQRVQVGVAVLPDFGRSASSADRLRGWGDIGAGADVKLFGTYSFGAFALLADVRRQVGAGNGTLIDAGATSTNPLARHFVLSTTATITWADARHARAYFGVDGSQSSQALARGWVVPGHSAGAGLRDAALTILAIVPIDDRWSVQSLARAEVLLGDAATSPLTERRIQPTFGGLLAYRL